MHTYTNSNTHTYRHTHTHTHTYTHHMQLLACAYNTHDKVYHTIKLLVYNYIIHILLSICLLI